MKPRRKGFTLIELLVVIAIIAILAAILFPVISSAKERSRQAMCCSNLKQLMMAIRAYCDDHQGMLPRVIEWGPGLPDWAGNQTCGVAFKVSDGPIWKYVRNAKVYACPTDIAFRGNTNWPLSYSMNWKLGTLYGVRHTTNLETETVGRSGHIMVLIHEQRDRINDGFYAWGNEWDIPSAVHYSGTTAVYADGHVKWAAQSALIREMERRQWYPNTEYYKPTPP